MAEWGSLLALVARIFADDEADVGLAVEVEVSDTEVPCPQVECGLDGFIATELVQAGDAGIVFREPNGRVREVVFLRIPVSSGVG
jgi:hypothetical protein